MANYDSRHKGKVVDAGIDMAHNLGPQRVFSEEVKDSGATYAKGIKITDTKMTYNYTTSAIDVERIVIGGTDTAPVITTTQAGNINDLKTDEKNLVNAINEVWGQTVDTWQMSTVKVDDKVVSYQLKYKLYGETSYHTLPQNFITQDVFGKLTDLDDDLKTMVSSKDITTGVSAINTLYSKLIKNLRDSTTEGATTSVEYTQDNITKATAGKSFALGSDMRVFKSNSFGVGLSYSPTALTPTSTEKTYSLYLASSYITDRLKYYPDILIGMEFISYDSARSVVATVTSASVDTAGNLLVTLDTDLGITTETYYYCSNMCNAVGSMNLGNNITSSGQFVTAIGMNNYNAGTYSTVMGYGNVNKGKENFVFGDANAVASATTKSTVVGIMNTLLTQKAGYASAVIGGNNYIEGGAYILGYDNSFTTSATATTPEFTIGVGQGNTLAGHNSMFLGNYLKTLSAEELALGIYNYSHVADDTKGIGYTKFTIGGGTADDARLNLMEWDSLDKLYIKGIGGFTGANSGEDDVKSLQEVLSSTGGITAVETIAEYSVETYKDTNNNVWTRDSTRDIPEEIAGVKLYAFYKGTTVWYSFTAPSDTTTIEDDNITFLTTATIASVSATTITINGTVYTRNTAYDFINADGTQYWGWKSDSLVACTIPDPVAEGTANMFPSRAMGENSKVLTKNTTEYNAKLKVTDAEGSTTETRILATKTTTGALTDLTTTAKDSLVSAINELDTLVDSSLKKVETITHEGGTYTDEDGNTYKPFMVDNVHATLTIAQGAGTSPHIFKVYSKNDETEGKYVNKDSDTGVISGMASGLSVGGSAVTITAVGTDTITVDDVVYTRDSSYDPQDTTKGINPVTAPQYAYKATDGNVVYVLNDATPTTSSTAFKASTGWSFSESVQVTEDYSGVQIKSTKNDFTTETDATILAKASTVGNLNNLNTTTKANVVGAINEVIEKVNIGVNLFSSTSEPTEAVDGDIWITED